VEGQYSGGTALELFTVGDLDSVWVVGDVHEMDLGRVKAGTACLVTVVSYPGRVFRGRADWLSDMLDPVTHTAKVRCQIANPDRALKPEMFATVTFPSPANAHWLSRAAHSYALGTGRWFLSKWARRATADCASNAGPLR